MHRTQALDNYYLLKTASRRRDCAYGNYLLVKEGKLMPMLQRGVSTVKSGVTNVANKATMHMGKYRVAPGGPVLGKSFDAGLGGGTPAELLKRNRATAANQLMTNPHVRQQAVSDATTQGIHLLTQAQVGGGNWALARQFGQQMLF